MGRSRIAMRVRRLRLWMQSSLVQASSADCAPGEGQAPIETLRALLQVVRELEMLASGCSLDSREELVRQFESSLSLSEEKV